MQRVIHSASHAYLSFDGTPPLKMQIFFHSCPTLPMAQDPISAPWTNSTAAGPVQPPTALPCLAIVPTSLTHLGTIPAQPYLMPGAGTAPVAPVTLLLPSCTGASSSKKGFRREIWQNYVSL